MLITLHWSHDPFLFCFVCVFLFLFFLGLDLVESQFPGGGVGLASSEHKHFQKGELIAQYIGRYLVLTKPQTEELFHPMFFENHERLIELGPIMQPIVYSNHSSPLDFRTVSVVPIRHFFFFFFCSKQMANCVISALYV